MYAKNRWLILTMVASALFLIVIDMTVLYTALPRLTQALDASASQKLWIVNAYPLVVAGRLPGARRLSARLGTQGAFAPKLAAGKKKASTEWLAKKFFEGISCAINIRLSLRALLAISAIGTLS